jgi:hypothetical protein
VRGAVSLGTPPPGATTTPARSVSARCATGPRYCRSRCGSGHAAATPNAGASPSSATSSNAARARSMRAASSASQLAQNSLRSPAATKRAQVADSERARCSSASE